MRLVIQAVGGRIDTYFDRPWAPDETPSTRLVVIGLHGMERSAIEAAIAAATLPTVAAAE
jgi:cobalamin biosynthesis protein CobW